MSGLVRDFIVGYAEDFANEYAQENFQPVIDPYYARVGPQKKKVRRELPAELFSKQERKRFKTLQSKSWTHDRSMCGCCCWTECIGWAPVFSIIPVVGPIIMYMIHNSLVTYAERNLYNNRLPTGLKTKLLANITFDLCITLVPVLGALFSWLNGCSTRNTALIYNDLVEKRMKQVPQYQQAQTQQAQTQQAQAQQVPQYRTQQQAPAQQVPQYRTQQYR